MNAPAPGEVRALLRLRVMREEAAQATVSRCRVEAAACQRIFDERVAQIAQLHRTRHALMAWLSGPGASAVPRTSDCAGAHRAALDDELERAEAELVDEHNDLQDASKKLEAARQAWLRERARREAVEHLGQDLRRAWARTHEERIEREVEPRQRLEI